MEKLAKIFNIFYKIIFGLLIVLILSIAVSIIPLPGNYRIYSVVSGSMEPSLPVGSIVFVKSQSDYQIGDIVTFKTPKDPKNSVTHRLVAKDTSKGNTVYSTKGDANQTKDIENLSLENIVGKVFFNLPFIGYPISYSKTLPGLMILVVVPSTIIIYSEILNIKNEAVRLVKKKQKKDEPSV
jgi:signal peptidase